MPNFETQHNDALAIVKAFEHTAWADSYAELLLHLLDHLPWTSANIETATIEHLDKNGLTLDAVLSFLRAALTGQTVSAPIWTVIHSLGAQTSNMRILNPDNTAKWRLIVLSDKPKIVRGSATMQGVAAA